MDIISNLAIGFGQALSLWNLIYCFIGVFLGTIVGVLPGLGPIATMVNIHLGFATPNFLIQEVMRSDVPWRDEIISLQHRKIQKLARHSCANRVKPNVARPGLAEAIPIKSGKRILTATLQLRSQNIRRHAWTISPALVRCTIVVPAKL